MYKKLWITTLLMLVIVPVTTWSQERVQADVEVKSILVTESAGKLTCEVKVFNTHDDNAHDTMLQILLPVGVKVEPRLLPPRCTVSTGFHDGSQGFVTCRLGELGVGDSKIVRIVARMLPSGSSKKFGAFAWSRTPDPDPSNNHMESQ